MVEVSEIETMLKKIFSVITTETYKNLVEDLVNLWKAEEIKIDVSIQRIVVGIPEVKRNELSNKHGITPKVVSDVMILLARSIRIILMDRKEDMIKQIKDNKNIELAKEVFKISLDMLNKCPDIKNRFLTVSFCKTKFLEDIDWEINEKIIQPKYVEFEKSDRYLICLLRFILSKTSPPGVGLRETEEFVFEVSFYDLNRMIRKLSLIREKLMEANKELLEEEKQ